jgi:hypothetical protein
MAVLGSSTSLEALASKARFERAFFGFLIQGKIRCDAVKQSYAYTVLSIVKVVEK